MATQVSAHSNTSTHETRRGAAAWIIARMATAAHVLRRAVSLAFAGVKNGRVCTGRQKQMQLVESLALGNRRQLLLVVCDNRRYLVGAGPDSVGSILAVEADAEFDPKFNASFDTGSDSWR